MFPGVLNLAIFVAQHSKTKSSTPTYHHTAHCWKQVSILDRLAFPRFKNKCSFSIDSAATNCATISQRTILETQRTSLETQKITLETQSTFLETQKTEIHTSLKQQLKEGDLWYEMYETTITLSTICPTFLQVLSGHSLDETMEKVCWLRRVGPVISWQGVCKPRASGQL